MNYLDVMKHVVMLLRDGPDNGVQEAVDALTQAIEQAGKQEPVDAVLLSDMVEGHHPEYGRGLFATDNCVQKFYTNSPTAPAEIDFLQHDDHLRFIQRVLESDAPDIDVADAAQMVRDIRRSIRPTAPAQQPLTDEQIRDLVKECGLNWHIGFYPLFDGDETNRFAVLVQATEAAHGITGETK